MMSRQKKQQQQIIQFFIYKYDIQRNAEKLYTLHTSVSIPPTILEVLFTPHLQPAET